MVISHRYVHFPEGGHCSLLISSLPCQASQAWGAHTEIPWTRATGGATDEPVDPYGFRWWIDLGRKKNLAHKIQLSNTYIHTHHIYIYIYIINIYSFIHLFMHLLILESSESAYDPKSYLQCLFLKELGSNRAVQHMRMTVIAGSS